jgi:lycopene cyclase CruA
MIDAQRARSRVREAGGVELLDRLDHLDATRTARGRQEVAPPPPEPGASVDFDVVIAGGGLWSLLAPLLAARGLRVAVVDRARIGQSHREWNASGPELQALVRVGLADEPTIHRWVVARYARGICRFDGGRSYAVEGVLDHAVDAGALLAYGRWLAERRGVTLLDGHTVLSHGSGRDAVRLRLRTRAGELDLVARCLVDARGAASPYATADLVCPTVGGVVSGLAAGDADDEVDADTGEILATADGVEAGRQHVWEAFPGRPGETTVYLFYYAHRDEPVSLATLFARFFSTLPTYKRGQARLLRPTFGLIPGWSRLSSAPRPPDRRVVLVGDAAARHSPLTCCGFGATLRSLDRSATAIAEVAAGRPIDDACIVDDAPVHSVTGALARVMASRRFRGAELNALLDAAFATLADMGEDAYGRLLRDEIPPGDVIRFLRRTAARHPAVWRHVLRVLGPRNATRWGLGIARSMLRASH